MRWQKIEEYHTHGDNEKEEEDEEKQQNKMMVMVRPGRSGLRIGFGPVPFGSGFFGS